MAQAVPNPPPGFDELALDEKLHYVATLWDRIVAVQDALPLSQAQQQLVRERLAAHQADPDTAKPWSEVRAEIEKELGPRGSR